MIMRKYRPESWSKQARRMADKQWEQYIYYNENPAEDTELFFREHIRIVKGEILGGEIYSLMASDIRVYRNFFSTSYRHPLIRQRAAKRFGRLARKAGKN